MEKRLLLAFVLSLAVFIGWGAFMAQFEPQGIKKTDIAKTSKSPSVPAPGQSTVVTSPLTSPQQSDFQPGATPAIVSSPFPGNEKEIQV